MEVNNLLTRAMGSAFSGLGITILGNAQGKYNFNHDYTPLNVRTVFVDVSYNELLSIAMNVPHLNIVIHRGAEMFSLMRVRHVDKDGNDIENSEVLEMLKKPSVLRTWEQWLYDYYAYKCIYNNVMMFPLRGLPSMLPKYINILPSGLMKVNLTGKLYRQIDIKGIIESWSMLGDPTPFKPEEIVHIGEGLSMNGVIYASPIAALQLPLSNIVASLKSENIIITERGMIGFLRTDSKDDAGPLPLNRTAKKAIQETYQSKYSLDSQSGHVGVFSGRTEWVSMSFDMQQLGIRDSNREHFAAILSAYGQPKEMYAFMDSATYENQREARKSFINDTLRPAGVKLLNKLAMDVFYLQNGEQLLPDFDYLPIMQEDQIKEGQAKMYTAQAADIMFKSGIIDADTYAKICETEMTGTGVPLGAPAPNTDTPPAEEDDSMEEKSKAEKTAEAEYWVVDSSLKNVPVKMVKLSKIKSDVAAGHYDTPEAKSVIKQYVTDMKDGEKTPAITVDKNNIITNGHHRYLAAIAAGKKYVGVQYV